MTEAVDLQPYKSLPWIAEVDAYRRGHGGSGSGSRLIRWMYRRPHRKDWYVLKVVMYNQP
jgi:hypothetical protein